MYRRIKQVDQKLTGDRRIREETRSMLRIQVVNKLTKYKEISVYLLLLRKSLKFL